jgi:3',5'-cyclic AMP phosphodiesterase CpdA
VSEDTARQAERPAPPACFTFAVVADLHFGTVPEGLAAALLDDLAGVAPDLVVIAGDLTIRARHREFVAAHEWMEALGRPLLLLPGNHDLPYFNLLERFTNPYRRYFSLANGALDPVHDDGRHIIAGLNTTRSWQPHWRWPEGVARRCDVEAVAARLNAARGGAFRAVFTHHPLIALPEVSRRIKPVLGGKSAVEALAASGAELLLSGHVHRSFVHEFGAGRRILAVGAPTALSNRLRGEGNGYWVIRVAGSALALELRRSEPGDRRFGPGFVKRFDRAQFSTSCD